MAKRDFDGGLHEVAEGVFAYLQPQGGWGLSNAGLVTSGEESLLVDTLFDRLHTERMLEAMRRASSSARAIDLVVNTHANGDHCWGNELVRESRIVSSEATAREMSEMTPAKLATLMKVAGVGAGLGAVVPGLGRMVRAIGLTKLGSLLEASDYVRRAFGQFRFDGIELVLPTETFSGSTELLVGERRVELLEVGPAHTVGDVMAFVPDAQTVFTGDILFADAHPLLWEGPVSNWIAACDAILEREVKVVVPGHGPLCDGAKVQATREYLEWLLAEATRRRAAGMTAEEAALDLDLGLYAEWSEPERVTANMAACYRELGDETAPSNVIELFGAMARWEKARGS